MKLSDLITSDQVAALPVGAVIISASAHLPPGGLRCNGAAVSRIAYAALFARIGTAYGSGDGSTTFNIPDARGVFPRFVDDGRGLDPGRTLGSYQADMIKSHNHVPPGTVRAHLAGANSPSHPRSAAEWGFKSWAEITAFGGIETRPKNLAFHAFIKY